MAFDLITMAATISELESSGQIGSGEAGKSYAWDGDQENKIYVPYKEGGGFVKVSDDMPDLRKFEKIETIIGTCMPDGDGHYFVDGTAENGELFGAKGTALIQSSAGGPVAVVITDTLNSPIPSTGLYFVATEIGNGNVVAATLELVMPSTIKTIDSKYLPSGSGGGGGGELPVIDLTELGIEVINIFEDGEHIFEVTPEALAKLTYALQSQGLVRIRFMTDPEIPEIITSTFTHTTDDMYNDPWYFATSMIMGLSDPNELTTLSLTIHNEVPQIIFTVKIFHLGS